MALLRNDWLEVEVEGAPSWLAELSAVLGSCVPREEPARSPYGGRWQQAFADSTAFEELESASVEHEETLDVDSVLAQIASWSFLDTLGVERTRIRHESERVLRAHMGPGVESTFVVPYRTQVWWARALSIRSSGKDRRLLARHAGPTGDKGFACAERPQYVASPKAAALTATTANAEPEWALRVLQLPRRRVGAPDAPKTTGAADSVRSSLRSEPKASLAIAAISKGSPRRRTASARARRPSRPRPETPRPQQSHWVRRACQPG